MEQFFNLDEDGESSHLINYLSENNIYGDFVLMIDLNVLGLTDKDVRKLSGGYLAYYASNLIKEDIDKSNINIYLEFLEHDGSAISSITTLYFDMQISEIVELIKETVGYNGKLVYDTTKPDGTMLKLMDVSRINALGWKAKTNLKEGLKIAYNDFLSKNNL